MEKTATYSRKFAIGSLTSNKEATFSSQVPNSTDFLQRQDSDDTLYEETIQNDPLAPAGKNIPIIEHVPSDGYLSQKEDSGFNTHTSTAKMDQLSQSRPQDASSRSISGPSPPTLASTESKRKVDSADEVKPFKTNDKHHKGTKILRTRIRRASPARTDGHQKSRMNLGKDHINTTSEVARDGRIDIALHDAPGGNFFSKTVSSIQKHLRSSKSYPVENKISLPQKQGTVPRMNIVIMVIGSRGDIQPFLKIGKILKDKYHHRVRIASHPTFRKFVEDDVGLEFFSVGGDPAELMAFMVKNPGLMPSFETLKAGEVRRRRDAMYDMFQGFWRACINATDGERDVSNLEMMQSRYPFVADAIIANPPSFAHYHCAEKLNIPLHLVFTFPYQPTQDFPHPLANIKYSNVDQSHANFMSYLLVDLMTWQGLGDMVNRFRVQTLGLEPVSTLGAAEQLSRLKVPTTYLWSPSLVPKPSDWGPEVDLAGYVFLDLASSYTPTTALSQFLETSDHRPLVYVGFGSISGIDDPTSFTKMVLEAVEKAGVRAIISKGWGGMGEGLEKPDSILLIDNVPHDWLFPKVDAVIHHGGAGTTAAGLKYGKPTMIVPFFGDQPFWSAMVAKAGAGAKEALPLKSLDSDKFAEGIRQCLEPEAKLAAQKIAKSIEAEGDGAENAIESFHKFLPLEGSNNMRCGLFSDRTAVWKVKHTSIQLSALAAQILVENNQLQRSDLQLKRHLKWKDFHAPLGPISGAGGVTLAAVQEAIHGLHSIPEITKRDIQQHRTESNMRSRHSVAEAVTLPGRISLASRGTTLDQVRHERASIDAEINLRGNAEPFKHPFRSMQKSDQANGIGQVDSALLGNSQSPSVSTIVLQDLMKGFGHSANVVARFPLDFFNALALGFRNAPRAYGDKSVRPLSQSITNLSTGIKIAGSEFCLGFYDGIIGLVRLPYTGYHDDNLTGVPVGIARGVGGLIFKPVSGILGLAAYTGKGLHASIRSQFRDTQKTDRWIQRARISQGVKELEIVRQEVELQQKANLTADQTPGLEDLMKQAIERWVNHQKRSPDLTVDQHLPATRQTLTTPTRAQTS